MSDFTKSEKYLAARESLPESLQPIFHQLVEEYAYHTHIKYGKGYVAYAVLAELVRDGWRPPDNVVKGQGKAVDDES